jgi:hypothetical protein
MLNKDINFIVSGLERSGTSLMMQMLHRAGLRVAFDNLRPADEHNPRGYYELIGGKIISRLMDGQFDMQSYRGHIIKVTAYGIRFLPKSKYKIIYMIRNIDEVLQSMRKMGVEVEVETDKMLFDKLNRLTLELMRRRDDIEYVAVRYRDLIENPKEEIEKVSAFLDVTLDINAAIGAVDTALYRNREPL